MEDKYLCQLCMQPFDEPRLLDCLHTFCTNCLVSKAVSIVKSYSQDEGDSSLGLSSGINDITRNDDSKNEVSKDVNISSQILSCPTCGTETSLTNGGISSLPINLKLQKDIIEMKNKLPPCDLCSTTACAFTRCFDCDIMMCALCTDSHKEFRDTTLHTLVQLKTETETIFNSKVQQAECKEHYGQAVNFFCWTCSELICYTCCSSTHSGHKIDSVTQSAAKAEEGIKSELMNVKPIVKQYALNVDAVKNKVNKIKNRCEDVEKEIDNFMQSYKEALENHWQSLINDVETIKQKRIESLQKHYECLEKTLKTGQNAIDLAEDLLQDSTPIEILCIANPILNRLQKYNEVDIKMEAKVSEFLKFLPDEKLVYSNSSVDSKTFQLYGIISTQSISPDNCTLQIDGLLSCRQHKKSSFVLQTRDSENLPLSHGGEKIVAELRYKDAVQRVVPVFVNDEGNGTYILSFTPNISGNMSLTVLVQDKHIKGSPYGVFVSSLRPHTGIFHCCAFCSSGGNKAAKCGCNGKMPGGYNGCGHGHSGHPGRRHWSCCGNVLQNSECSQLVPY